MKQASMTRIKDALGVMKPWFDDPKTHEVANECMMVASFVGLFRASGNWGAEAEASAMLKQLSESSKIPYQVLSTYADGVAALDKHASRESLMTKTGEQ
ncbi:hypothetical protein GNZ12_33530 [Paraburkholderia sp. 1N]|uniref:Phage protein n=1 Tax=Paraburkholderia solitsugae TaxID=2675748 RepID=A0ABX2BZK4_9BURK|nr:hypothetical protein [Paraburkholderia solitsugae]NPT46159.1 hypothetical protein [Paraburkholderia solitsugae]